MKAIILAAGRGSRMQRLTDERPKCLVEIGGRTLLDRQLASLRGAGIDQIAVVTGYRRDMLGGRGLVEFHNPRWESTNMVASLACAAGWLREAACIVSYSDIFYEHTAVAALMYCAAPLAVTYDPDWRRLWERRFGDPLADAETFRLGAGACVADIGARPSSVEEIQGQYMGLLRIAPEGWQEIERIRDALPGQERDRIHMTGTLRKLIEAGRVPVQAVAYRGLWGEVDSAEDLAVYEGPMSSAPSASSASSASSVSSVSSVSREADATSGAGSQNRSANAAAPPVDHAAANFPIKEFTCRARSPHRN